MNSLFPDICSTALPESKAFYERLLGFTTVFQIDWYLQMQSPTDPNVQIAFVHRDHHSVPEAYRQPPQGVIVTVELNDVDAVFQRALDMRCDIVLDLRSEVWGQRHFMTRDPNGLLVDVIQLIEPSPEFLQEHGLTTE